MNLYKRVRNKLFPNNPELQKEKYIKENYEETRVLVAGLMQCKNFGDVVISDCTSYLVRKAFAQAKVRKLKLSTIDIRRQKDKASLNRVRNSDLVVFPGGGFIKYKQENFPKEMGRITDRAEHYGIPVMYNAMGVEDYDGSHEGCLAIREMLRRYSNRYITSRDFADLLNNTYLNDHSISAVRVADPAVHCADVYGISRDESSDVVGLGVARSALFTDHGIPVSGEQLLDIWENIISVLDSRNIRWKLFTNGLRQDEEFLTELLERLGKADDRESVSVPAPQTSRELVETISGFSSIIAVRMHANIIAFSLGIPSVAFVWNDKLRFFGESIGCSHRYLEYDMLDNADFIVDTMLDAQHKGYDSGALEREKKSAYKSVADFIIPFATNLHEARCADISKRKTVCWGLPNLESEKLNKDFFYENVDFFVSDDKNLVGTNCLSKPVYGTDRIKRSFGRRPFVIVSETIDYTPCAQRLSELGFRERWDFTNMHAYRRYIFKRGDIFIDNPLPADTHKS